MARDPGDDPRDALRDDVDDDVAAEIWLAGPMVGLGYANDPKRTAERFFQFPKTRRDVARDGGDGDAGEPSADRETERWFRTGDVARRGDGAPESRNFALEGY